MKNLLLSILLTCMCLPGIASIVYTPNTHNSVAGAATYCQGATPASVSFRYNTCNSGTGAASGIAITVNWYSNTVNSTSGGTLVSSTTATSATAATGTVTYVPATTDTGVLFYYCNITWDGTGACNATGTLTSSTTIKVTTTLAPTTISGASSVCRTQTTTLTNGISRGSWTSSAAGTASVNVSTGLVTGVAVGTCTITFTTGCGTPATKSMSVNTQPATITGTATVCVGANTTYANTVSGGSWTSSNSGVATIDGSTGVITGVAVGSATITYTIGSCFVIKAVTVNTTPDAIAGPSTVCTGTTITLTNSVSGGTWARTNGTGTCSIVAATGVVTGTTAGTATVSYTIGACRATYNITMNQTPVALTGTATVCEGLTTTYASTTPAGSFSSSNTSVASVDGTTGIISGIAAGSATITYTLGSCLVTKAVTVNITPAGISGSSTLCTGATSTYTNATSGGSWGRTNGTGVCTIVAGTGVLTPTTAGTATVSYTLGTCRATFGITMNVNPAAITGTATVCEGATTTFANTVSGGVWSSSNTSVATVDASTGVISGTSVGSATITYTIGSCFATKAVTVNITPGAISGATTVCAGASITLTDGTGGGTWTRTNGTGTCNIGAATGIVTALTAGTVTISYSIGTCRATHGITINVAPAAITGTTPVCMGSSTTYANTVSGGTWTSSNSAVASVDPSSGVIAGISNGSATITYTIGSCFAVKSITISLSPATISGATTVCTSASTTLTNSTPGGTWSRVNGTGTANINTGGVVSGLTAGSVNISYTIGSCRSTLAFNVIGVPASITGAATFCSNSTTALSNTTVSGSWSSSNSGIATANTSTGIITGVAAGSATITYSTGCGTAATRAITVTTPSAITGSSSICESATSTLGNSLSGGTWTSSNTAVATIDGSTGDITGVTVGTTNITYTTANCASSTTITVLPVFTPGSITGSSSVCETATTGYTAMPTGGSWSSDNASIASIEADGTVTGVASGSADISYTLSNACGTAVSSQTITVNPLPHAGSITGTTTICEGASTTLSTTPATGSWSTDNASVATIDASGNMTGVSVGTATISYTVTNSCGASSTTTGVTIVAIPDVAITSAIAPCFGYTTNIVFTGTPSATVTYNVDGGSDLTAVLSGGTFSLGTVPITSTHSYVLVDVHNATCTHTYGSSVTVGPVIMEWVGGTSGSETDWQTAANWSCGFVPGSGDDAKIPAGTAYSPIVASSASVAVNALTVAAGAGVQLNSGATLAVNGNLSNNGTVTGVGTLSLAGSSAQTIAGIGTVSYFNLNNSAGASIASSSRLTIKNVLSITTGSLATNDSLVLASDSIATASIGAIPSGSSVTGNVRIMQYIQGGLRRFRFWAHPFSTYIPLTQIQTYLDITGVGGAANGFVTTGSNNPSAFWYNPLYSNSALGSDPGWRAFTSAYGTVDSNRLHKHQGIRLFMRGIKGQGLGYAVETPLPNTIGMYGPINQGNQVIRLIKGTGANQDYNMPGNPYPSPVDLGTVAYNAKVAGIMVGASVFVWNASLGTAGQYQAITISTVSATPYYLQSCNSFQIRTANNGDSLVFHESDKSANFTTNLFRFEPEYVSLAIYDENYHPWDIFSLKFDGKATKNEDNDYDAVKPASISDLNFYSWSGDSKKLIVDARPFEQGKVIPLGINSTITRNFIIRTEGLAVPDGEKLYLHDKLLKQYVLLHQGTEYNFSINADGNTQGDNRFELAMSPASISNEIVNNGFDVSIVPNPVTDIATLNFVQQSVEHMNIQITDVTGAVIYKKDLGKQGSGAIQLPVSSLSSGLYFVQVTSGSQKVVQRFIKK